MEHAIPEDDRTLADSSLNGSPPGEEGKTVAITPTDVGSTAGAILHEGNDPGATAAFEPDAELVTADSPPVTAPARVGPPRPPRFLGDYEVLDEIGRGGMATVFRARQARLDRLVALKLIRDPSLASLADLRRFRSEAEVIARLDHPNIVPIYEIGQTDDQPYFSMKLFGGGNLASHVSRLKDDPRAVATLMAKVARGVHFAHQRTILHRDIKPSNILLDEQGEPFVSDFGLAKRIEERDSSLATLDGAVMGTPAYMPPEQARGQTRTLTTAADVYSLGATLYEALTGQPPFTGGSVAEILRRVLDEEPLPPRTLNSQLDRDLETICLKCLEKEPTRRYGSAEDLAEELERCLDGRPIMARPVSAWERGWKWAKRRKAVASLLAFLLVALVALFGVILGFNIQLRKALDLSNRGRYAADMTVARRAYGDREVYRARELLETYRDPNAGLTHLRGFEWFYLWGLCQPGRTELKGHSARVTVLTYHPKGTILASGSHDRSIRLWSLDGRSPPLVLRGHEAVITGLAFDPEGKRLASTSEDHSVRIWDVATGRHLMTLTRAETTQSPCFSPDGTSLLTAGGVSGEVTVWDLAKRRPRLELAFRPHAPDPDVPYIGSAVSLPTPWFQAIFSADGRLIFSNNGRWRGLIVRDALTGTILKVLGLERSDSMRDPNLSPDGRLLRAWGWGQRLFAWDTATFEPVPLLDAYRQGKAGRLQKDPSVTPIMSPDGSMAVLRIGSAPHVTSGQTAGANTVWDLQTGQVIDHFEGLRDIFKPFAFHPDSRELAWGEAKNVIVRRLTWKEEHPPVLVSQAEAIRAFAVNDDESMMAWAGDDMKIHVARERGRQPVGVLVGHRMPVLSLRFGAGSNGARLVSASVDGTARLWDPLRPDQAPLNFQLPGVQTPLNDAALADQARVVVTAAADGSLGFWEVASGRSIRVVVGHSGPAHALAVSPDGARVVSVGGDGLLILWDPRTGRRLAGPWRLEGPASRVSFSPDGSRIAVAGSIPGVEEYLAIVSSSGGRVLHRWAARSPVQALAFSPEGLRVVSAGSERDVSVWDPIAGRETITLPGHVQPVLSLVSVPGTMRLYSAGLDGTVRLWEGQE